MKEVFESLLGAFFIVLVTVASVACITTSIDARNADAAVQAYVTEIEHSNFSPGVVGSVFDQASEDGYDDVSITVFERNDDGTTSQRVVTAPSNVGDTHRAYMMKLTMSYDFMLDFLDASSTHTVTSYAR